MRMYASTEKQGIFVSQIFLFKNTSLKFKDGTKKKKSTVGFYIKE